MKKKLRMFLCAALTASMMATAPALVQAAEEKETTETTESNAVRQDLAGLKYDHSLELRQHWTGWTVSVFQEPMLTDGISTRLRKHWKMEVFLLLVSTVHRITN